MRPDEANDLSPAASPAPAAKRGRRIFVLAGATLLALGFVLYGITGRHGKEAMAAECGEASGLAQKLKPLVHGEVAALSLAEAPKPLPNLSFSGPDGKSLTLADFRGRDILLNLWATWCVPCRREMPALDRLQGKLGGPNFEVVTINIDTTKLDKPKAFLTEIGVKNLSFYADSKADVFQALKQDNRVDGLPTTILVGKDGCEIGTMAGPAQWDSDDALALIEALKK
jgi:thiol-disulfide isomerase/thioredoxin